MIPTLTSLGNSTRDLDNIGAVVLCCVVLCITQATCRRSCHELFPWVFSHDQPLGLLVDRSVLLLDQHQLEVFTRCLEVMNRTVGPHCDKPTRKQQWAAVYYMKHLFKVVTPHLWLCSFQCWMHFSAHHNLWRDKTVNYLYSTTTSLSWWNWLIIPWIHFGLNMKMFRFFHPFFKK